MDGLNLMEGLEGLDPSVVCVEFTTLSTSDEVPHSGSWRRLWPGHYDKILKGEAIYLAQFANGGGGACKYVFKSKLEWNGIPKLVYRHCKDQFPLVGVLVHSGRPKVVVNQQITSRDDGLVKAVSWYYSVSGKYITSKFFFVTVSWQRLR